MLHVCINLHLCLYVRFQNSDGELKYLRDAEELIRPERNTLLVSFTDLEGFNQELATIVQEEFYRYLGRTQSFSVFFFFFFTLRLLKEDQWFLFLLEESTPTCAVLCVTSPGIMGTFLLLRNSTLPFRIYQQGTSKLNMYTS